MVPGAKYRVEEPGDTDWAALSATVRAASGAGKRPSRFPVEIHFASGFLYGRAGRVNTKNTKNGGFRPGQCDGKPTLWTAAECAASRGACSLGHHTTAAGCANTLGPLGAYGAFTPLAGFATAAVQPGEVFTAMQVPPSLP